MATLTITFDNRGFVVNLGSNFFGGFQKGNQLVVKESRNQLVGRSVVSARGAGAFRPSSRPKSTRTVKGRPQMEGDRDDAPAMNEEIRYVWNMKLIAVASLVKETPNTSLQVFLCQGDRRRGCLGWTPSISPFFLSARSPSICFSVCFTSFKHFKLQIKDAQIENFVCRAREVRLMAADKSLVRFLIRLKRIVVGSRYFESKDV